jgi:hypothetical protein
VAGALRRTLGTFKGSQQVSERGFWYPNTSHVDGNKKLCGQCVHPISLKN